MELHHREMSRHLGKILEPRDDSGRLNSLQTRSALRSQIQMMELKCRYCESMGISSRTITRDGFPRRITVKSQQKQDGHRHQKQS